MPVCVPVPVPMRSYGARALRSYVPVCVPVPVPMRSYGARAYEILRARVRARARARKIIANPQSSAATAAG